ncbi:MAG: DUF1189 family protein [bacterium]
MKHKEEISFLDRIKLACRSTRFYHKIIEEPGKKTFYYLVKFLLLIFLIQAPFVFYTGWQISGEIAENLHRHLPEITFHNGTLQLKEDVPFEVPVYNEFRMLIDPRGEKSRQRLSPEIILVVSNKVLFIRSREGFRTVYTNVYSEGEKAPKLLIDRDFLATWLPRFRIMLAITTLLLLVISLVSLAATRVLLLSVAALIAKTRSQKSFSWGQLVIISSYVLTPIFLAETLFIVSGISFPHLDFLILLGGALWLFYIVNTFSTPPENQADEGDILDRMA